MYKKKVKSKCPNTYSYPPDERGMITTCTHELHYIQIDIGNLWQQALIDIVNKIGRAAGTGSRQSVVTESRGCLLPNPKAFDTMNNIVANLLLNMTR